MRQKEKKKAKRLAKKNQVSSGTQNICESECSKNIEADEVSSEKSLTLITTSTTSVLKLSVEESSSAACKARIEEPSTKNRPEPTVDQNQTKKKRRKKTSKNEKKEKEADDEKLSKRRLSTDKAEPRRLNHDLPPFDNECILLPDPSEPRPSTSKSICEFPLTEVSSKIWQNHAETFSSTNSDEDEWIEASKKRNNPRIKRETSTKTNCVFKESDDSEPSQEASIVPFPTRSTTSHPAILSSESSSGGRVHIMILLSSAVARLIGHSGNTINGIRAASGAIIVIEKYKPMEKNTQMISIKGDVKDVRKAVKMIEMLIHDADTPVREIINRIMRDSIHVENTTPNRFALSKRMRYNSSSERNSCSQASYYEEKAFESDSNLMPTKSGSTLDLHFEALPSDLSKTPEKESNSKKVVKEENSEY
uniref:K Homology domain-containing protein n=1 Tax=Acrobeloides nanus TaxID=290746 RepID=A0A914D6N7_9BILA